MKQLTQRQIEVLAHVVIDPQAWWNHCLANHPDPENALEQKVLSWQDKYDLEKQNPNYKNRTQRELEQITERAAQNA